MFLVFLILLYFSSFVKTQRNCNETEIMLSCAEQENCKSCVRKHPCCFWCYDSNYFDVPRCITKDTQNHKCNPEYLEPNYETTIEKEEDLKFQDVLNNDVNSAVQLIPKKFNVTLRLGQPVNLTVKYKPAKNYPLDLYYLMDLTKSMEGTLNLIKTLGSNLTELLVNLTENHQIAFGSYIDNPEMPFYQTSPEDYENPCKQDSQVCEKGYLFKHKLNFTKNVQEFIQEVSESSLSGNNDDPEGGLAALMQILNCGPLFNWIDKSRKLVVIATEGLMHLAGDGLLAGYVKKISDDKCLMDPDGNYVSKDHYDYPSLEEIFHNLKLKKTNLIIAASSNSHDYYMEMKKGLNNTIFVGQLEEDSTNVLELVEEGYNSFARLVHLFVNISDIPGLKIDFFSDCYDNSIWEKSAMCENAQVGKVISFKIQLELLECMDDNSKEIFIEESSIYDKISINLKFAGCNCNCPSAKKPDYQCGKHGTVNCGNCTCEDGWTGLTCSERCENDLNKCRLGENGKLFTTCSGNGDCICSKCHCYPPYTGSICQQVCPMDKNRKICSGHGSCHNNGQCICNDNYSGSDCSCFESVESCTRNGKICSENGKCKCDRCECEEGHSGQWCQICDFCNKFCEEYKSSVGEIFQKKLKNLVRKGNTVLVETVKNLPEEERSCVERYTSDNGENCEIYFKISSVRNNTVKIIAMEPHCYKPIAATIVGSVIIAVLLGAGILFILLWKARNIYLDKKEYEAFVKNQEMIKMNNEINPLYNSPIVMYQNPMQNADSKL